MTAARLTLFVRVVPRAKGAPTPEGWPSRDLQILLGAVLLAWTAPAPVHARLPDVTALVILLGIEGAMPEIPEEVCQLLPKGALHLGGCGDEAPDEALSEKCAHVPSASRRAWRRSLS